MTEKIYNTMKRAGVGSLVMGILLIVVSTIIGVGCIVNGARLLAKKSDLLF